MSWDLQTTPTFAGYSKSTTESFPAIIRKGGERFYSKRYKNLLPVEKTLLVDCELITVSS